MKRNSLRIQSIIGGFLFILIFAIIFFCLTFCGRVDTDLESSNHLPETEKTTIQEIIVTTTTSITIETFINITTEDTLKIDETTTTTTILIKSMTTKETTTETSYDEYSETVEETTLVSTEVTSETSLIDTTLLIEDPIITTSSLKTPKEIAEEIWQGLWGNGQERKDKIESAGYDYNEIQKLVDEIGKTFNSIDDICSLSNIQFVKTFTRGTYYAYGGPRKGGSGRQLIDCSQGGNGVKGSIASRYLYNNYGYNYNGKRTKVYLEIDGYSSMNGYYYLDDSCAAGLNNVIDFFYLCNNNCQFQNQGVVKVNCYIVK